MRVRFTRRALSDLQRIFSYIADDNVRAASSFTSAIEDFVAVLAEHPDLGRPVPGRAARMIPIPRLQYLILFRVSGVELQVLNVRHGRRRPVS